MIIAAVLTVLIETSLFFLYGYRQKTFLYVVVLANLLTNVSLNLVVFLSALLCARQILPGFVLFIVIAAGEAAAVAVEYVVYETYTQNGIRVTTAGVNADENADNNADKNADNNACENADEVSTEASDEIPGGIRSSRQKRRLFLQVLLSNAVSFGAGLLLTHFSG